MTHLVVLAASSDPRPDANSVVAGAAGATVFVLLIVAVALLLWSFTRQLKKARAAQEAGVYDEKQPDLPPTTVEHDR
jgi:cbb3-type cytochrome oxidase subunit 3